MTNVNGFLTSLVDANGNPASVGTNAPGTGAGSETVAAASLPASQQSSTETIYDSYGNPVRVIKSFPDPNTPGQIDYLVTVTSYQYGTSDPSLQLDDIFQPQTGNSQNPGFSRANVLVSTTQYAPFVVDGINNDLRYIEQPTLASHKTAYVIDNGDGTVLPGFGQPRQDMTYQSTDANGNLIYSVVSYGYSYAAGIKPVSVTTSIETIGPDGSEIGTQMESATSSSYDAWGNLIASTDATGTTTCYDYTTPDNTAAGDLYAGLPDGLLLDTYQLEGWNAASDTLPASLDSYRTSGDIGQYPAYLTANPPTHGIVLLSSNVYYTSTNASTGAVQGMLAYSTQWHTNSVGQSTYYAYDAMGNTVATWVQKSWSNSSGGTINGFTVNITTYDSAGRSVNTSQGTFVGTGALGIIITSADPTASLGSSASVDQVSISNALYVDATQSSLAGGTAMVTGHTDYNTLGQVADTIDQYGGHTTYTYDINGNVIRTQYPDGAETRTVYDILGRAIWTSDKFVTGSTSYLATETFYNALGQAYKTERFSNVNITLGTDSNGQPTTFAPTGMTGISYTLTYYDQQGRVIETDTNCNASNGAIGLRTGTVYYPDGQVEYTGMLNADAPEGGHAVAGDSGDTSYAFTANDFTSYTTYEYNLVLPVKPDGGNNDNPNDLYFVDRVIDPMGQVTDTWKESNGRVTWTVYPDGTYSTTLQGHIGEALDGTDSSLLDPGGYEVAKTAPALPYTDTTTVYIYDRNGNLTDVFQPHVTYTYWQPHWQYTYDLSGNKTSVADPRSFSSSSVSTGQYTTTYFYDENGNKVREVMPDGTDAETWSYNQFGQVATSVDFNGNKAVYQYFGSYATNQSAGALQQVSYYAPPVGTGPYTLASTVSYSYTALGQQRQVNDSSGTITTYTYDQNGNETSVETNITTAAIAHDEVIHYVYDPVTNLLMETWTGGPSVSSDSSSITETTYGYTAQGQLQTVSIVRQNSSWVSGSPTTTYTYDLDGNVTRISYPNGTETDYDFSQMWNTSGGIETVTNKRGSTVLSSFVYTFNIQRQKIESVETVLNVGESSTTTATINWTYDAEGHLINESYSDGVTADNYDNHYDYDAAGNRTVEYLQWVDPYHWGSSNTYTYNADGQLVSESDGIPYGLTGSSHAAANISYTYDNNGSLIETDSTATSNNVTTTTLYGYDERGRMTSMIKGGVTTNYAYNTNGDRIGEYNSSSSSTYVMDDNNPTGYSQVLETWTGGSTPAVTYEIGSAILSQTVSGSGSGAGTQYIMPDGHGSTRQLTSYTISSGTNGQVVAREDYDGFGNSITIVAVPANIASTVILYVGQMWDPGPQTYDDRAREYDPRIGRFNSFDDIDIAPDDIVNANRYLYANADPVNVWDPSGHEGDLASTEASVGIDALLLTIGIGGALYASTHTAASVRAISAATNEISNLLSSGEAALVHEGTILASNTAAVVAAIDKAEAEANAAALALWKASASIPPIFPIIKSAGSAVYDLDVAALAANPAWYVLNYNGPLSLATVANRALVKSKFTGVIPAGSSLDEFPYASTLQGGIGAMAAPVPAIQNLVQGGLLSAFYRYSLKGAARAPFLVVPLNI